MQKRIRLYGLMAGIMALVIVGNGGYISAQVGHGNVVARDEKAFEGRIVHAVHIVRTHPNKYLTTAAIENYVPYKKGEPFDPALTNQLIKKLFALGFFENIAIKGTLVSDNKIDVYVVLDEAPEIVDIEINGNENIDDQKLEKELKLSELRSISQRKMDEIIKKLRKLYYAKDYHLVDIKGEIKIDASNKATLVLNINEHGKSLVERVFFKGNHQVSNKKLRSIIFTREDWILSFASGAGSYQADKIANDKRYIESYYKTIGYMAARVTDVQVVMDQNTKQYSITFVIDEGDLYHIKELSVKGTYQLSEYELLKSLPMKAGAIYSIKDVMDSIEVLKKIFGEFGYIFIDIQPSIVPDELAKTVNVSFDIDLGDQVHLGRLTIKGNKKTRDHIIRRKVTFSEGDLLTNQGMEFSKQRVEALSFWDKEDGVQWKVHRVNNHVADLDLILKEAKTGKIVGGIGWGGNENMQSSSGGFNWNANIYDINFLGRGLQFNLGASWSKQEWAATVDFTEPFLMDMPLLVGYNLHCNKVYRSEDLTNTNNFAERYLGGSVHAGYLFTKWSIDTMLNGVFGVENVKLNHHPLVTQDARGCPGALTYQKILDQSFKDGTMYYFNFEFGQDLRNNLIYPTNGFQWSVEPRVAIPSGHFGFFKIDADYSWYTPLIAQYDLIFCFHTHLGYVRELNHKIIPFKELFNIGGPASVRGFEWGEISPSVDLNPCRKPDEIYGRSAEPIGGQKAFFVNLELEFPIKKDHSFNGAFFYDGGSGWCPPPLKITKHERDCYIRNSEFDYRQAIGFGIRMLQPQNIKIEWGFKIDRRPGETPYEVHFSTYREF